MFLSRHLRICKHFALGVLPWTPNIHPSYFVTELLGTDLHRLLTSRPLEKQFIQYFLYQILVRCSFDCVFPFLSRDSERFEIRALCWRRAP